MKLHLALVTHRHGTNCYASHSEADLKQKLVTYVTESIVSDRHEHLAGLPDDEVVEAYFDDVEHVDETVDYFVEEIRNPLLGPLQWLLDDMHDTGQTMPPTGTTQIFDSVENAAAALVEEGGALNWYSAEQAAAFRQKEA